MMLQITGLCHLPVLNILLQTPPSLHEVGLSCQCIPLLCDNPALRSANKADVFRQGAVNTNKIVQGMYCPFSSNCTNNKLVAVSMRAAAT